MTTNSTAMRGTADLCDDHGDHVQVCEPVFHMYGGRRAFHGPISTVFCFEDNSRVKEAVESPGNGQVLVVDGGGSRRCALVGDVLAGAGLDNGWAGVIVAGCVRDTAALASLGIGVMALGVMPRRSEKQGQGVRDVPLEILGARVRPDDYVYADEDGVVFSPRPLSG